MKPLYKNILAVVAGILVGGALNGFIVSISASVIPLPNGIDPNDTKAVMDNIAQFPLKNFIMPFLAHALGTLLAAFLAVKLAASNHFRLATIVGGVFFLGGLSMVFVMQAPMWYNIVDLAFAYFPMAYLGALLAGARGRSTSR